MNWNKQKNAKYLTTAAASEDQKQNTTVKTDDLVAQKRSSIGSII